MWGLLERGGALAPGVLTGTSDCEEIHDSILAQPTLALSSLSFVAAGGWLLWSRRSLPTPQRWAVGTYAGLLVLVGVGSVDFHGPRSPAAQILHDVPIALVIAQGVAVPLVRAVRREPVLRSGTRRGVITTAALGLLAGAAYAAGRSGSPLCDPTSWYQSHGVWHVLSAAALAAWGSVLWPAPEPAESP